ncbi:hypothetical protein FACS1894147_01950 [Spirochaetia bacterium]|nr:hypothetical protein FACS1894147_01950 [Spirochaetia bacterium]
MPCSRFFREISAIPDKPITIEDFEKLLLERSEPEKPYGIFGKDITMCRMSASKNGEELLADISRKNREQGMGNYQIPNTRVTLINYSVCPKCARVFSFRDLRVYYNKPKPDPLFKSVQDQYRNDTRVCCDDCGTYFLPALIISDGTPRNEVQFLCRMQTIDAIEKFYQKKGKAILSKNPGNILEKNGRKGLHNDVLLQDLSEKPTLISNLLQYTPAPLAINLLDGSNVKQGDVIYGVWNWGWK